MTATVIRLDPNFPLRWENEHTLRAGFDEAVARLAEPSVGVQRLLGKLRLGIPLEALPREARRMGATSFELGDVLRSLGPVLLTSVSGVSKEPRETAPPDRLAVEIVDGGRAVPGFREMLEALATCRVVHDEEPPVSPRPAPLIILIERFLEPLERAHRWLVAGREHLLVQFTDQAVAVGPVVRAGGNPCHTCVTLHTLGEDAALSRLAAQLIGIVPGAETAVGARVAADWVSVFLHTLAADQPEVHRTRVHIPMRNGAIAGMPTMLRVTGHPECACAVLQQPDRAPR